MNFKDPAKDKHRIRASLDITPLVDVVFNLIIFFMLSSTFVVQSSIQIQTPEAEGTRQLEAKDISVTLQFGEGGFAARRIRPHHARPAGGHYRDAREEGPAR